MAQSVVTCRRWKRGLVSSCSSGTNRRVVLTEAGRTYLPEIGAALDRIALATARQKERGQADVLHVNALATFTLRWLIPRLSAFQRAHPAVEIRLTTRTCPSRRSSSRSTSPFARGPDARPGFVGREFLTERAHSRLQPPAPAARPPLEARRPSRHTLLHAATLPDVWPHWLQAAGVANLTPRPR